MIIHPASPFKVHTLRHCLKKHLGSVSDLFHSDTHELGFVSVSTSKCKHLGLSRHCLKKRHQCRGSISEASRKRLGCSLDRKMSGEVEARGALPAGDGVVRLWCPRRRQSQAELPAAGRDGRRDWQSAAPSAASSGTPLSRSTHALRSCSWRSFVCSLCGTGLRSAAGAEGCDSGIGQWQSAGGAGRYAHVLRRGWALARPCGRAQLT